MDTGGNQIVAVAALNTDREPIKASKRALISHELLGSLTLMLGVN